MRHHSTLTLLMPHGSPVMLSQSSLDRAQLMPVGACTPSVVQATPDSQILKMQNHLQDRLEETIARIHCTAMRQVYH